MTKTLRVTARYRNTQMRADWSAGRIDSFPDATAAYLLRDAPGSFEEVDPAALEAADAVREAALVEAYGVNQQVVVELPEEVPDEPEVTDELDSMSLGEVREYAKQHSVELSGLRRKHDVVAAVRAAGR
jgi:hypothetical protein